MSGLIALSFICLAPMRADAYTSVKIETTDILSQMDENMGTVEKKTNEIYDTYIISKKEDDSLKKNITKAQKKNLEYYISFRDAHMPYVEDFVKELEEVSNMIKTAENDDAYYLENKEKIQEEYKDIISSYDYIDDCAEILLNGYYEPTKKDIDEQEKVKKLIKKMKKNIGIKKKDSVKTKTSKINKYICKNYSYGSVDDNSSFYTCLKKKKIICGEYSKLFKLLCKEYDIKVAYYHAFRADNGRGHAWNIVKDEKGKRYYIDVTWNDSTSNWKKYFWLSKTKFTKTHGKYNTNICEDWD